MAHNEQLEFFSKCFEAFPEIFKNSKSKVIDLGSLDINGGPHLLMKVDYLGSDIGPGPNVDLVCPSQELSFESGSFDAAISSECFEHNSFWRESLMQMARLTKPGGLVIWSAAGIGRAVHGTATAKDKGVSAPFVANSNNYYSNLDARKARDAINHEGWYDKYFFLENFNSNDTYFFGVRHGGSSAQIAKVERLRLEMESRYGKVSTFKFRKLGYFLGLSQLVEAYFNWLRFARVLMLADKKIYRAKKRFHEKRFSI